MNEIIKNSLVLTLIMLLSVISLSFVHSITSPIVKSQEQGRFERTLSDVFNRDVSYSKKGSYDQGRLIGDYYEVKDSFNRLIGYGVIVSEKGYQSDINLLLVFDVNKKIYAVKVLKELETPGVGSRIESESFLAQFKGLVANDVSLIKDGGKVDAISGATISSSAVIKAVKEGFLRLP